MESANSNKNLSLDEMVGIYVKSNPLTVRDDKKIPELEVQFGTFQTPINQTVKTITSIDYHNVIQYIYGCGFTCDDTNGLNILRIYASTDTKKYTNTSNIRTEVMGHDLIKKYCETNDLRKLIMHPSTLHTTNHKIKFTQKSVPVHEGHPIKTVEQRSHNFKVAFKLEQDFSPETDTAKQIIDGWTDKLKVFRLINRVRFYHGQSPVCVDVSIVKTNHRSNLNAVPEYSIQSAGVFTNPEHYEIELEIDNTKVGLGTEYASPKALTGEIRRMIRIVMSALQGTSYPISYEEQYDVLNDYLSVVYNERGLNFKESPKEIMQYTKQTGDTYKITSSDFIGPSSVTLQIENVMQHSTDNIIRGYAVTEKADGERKLMFINGKGRVYLIDTNMRVINTGLKTENTKLHFSLIDGEFVTKTRTGDSILLYMAFDVYFVGNKSVRAFRFMETAQETADFASDPKSKRPNYRYNILKQLVKSMSLVHIVENVSQKCVVSVVAKEFKYNELTQTSCDSVMTLVKDSQYEYNTDGLILTHCSFGVGADVIGQTTLTGGFRKTWLHAYKWKPPQYNTIDFLVTTVKSKTGQDEVFTVFQDGVNLTEHSLQKQYCKIELRCGFDTSTKSVNPFISVLNDEIEMQRFGANTYKPILFQPNRPFDANAYKASIVLHKDTSGLNRMKTEEGEFFDGDTIVEFRYDIDSTETGEWKWIPLRVRHDKTAELKAGQNNFGNSFRVANDNWYSIFNPVTEEMLCKGINIPQFLDNDDVYYNGTRRETTTQALREFHNLFVKRKLIKSIATSGDTLIDFAVGKGGDLDKWRNAGISFVLGIDIARDNIVNVTDGACSRYLNARKQDKYMKLRALFACGNSGQNIVSEEAFVTEKDKDVIRSVFALKPKNTFTGKGLVESYGKGKGGFSISSCQFALHYFFESEHSLHEFIKNVCETTKVTGHFVGTCYDGQSVFNLLKGYDYEKGLTIFKGDNTDLDSRIFEITKMYKETAFPPDELSVGYKINVFQESINKSFVEYLVNFTYFTHVLSMYGFELVKTGMFGELFDDLRTEIGTTEYKGEYKSAPKMTQDEKSISFLNRYFVFKKMHAVDANDVLKTLRQNSLQQNPNPISNKVADPIVNAVKPVAKKRVRKMADYAVDYEE